MKPFQFSIWSFKDKRVNKDEESSGLEFGFVLHVVFSSCLWLSEHGLCVDAVLVKQSHEVDTYSRYEYVCTMRMCVTLSESRSVQW